jgi:hypothetical protein
VPAVRSQPSRPRTGTYALAVQGSESVRFSTVSFCNQRLPDRTSLALSPAEGEAPGAYNADVRYFPDRAGQHDERHIYRYSTAGVALDYEHATVTCQGVRQSTEVSFDPAQLRVQLPLRVGAQWSLRGGDQARTETGTSTVDGTEVVQVGKERVPTYRITTHIAISGDESGGRDQVWWYAPSWAFPVKWSERINAKRSGASYTEDVTVTVLSRP